MGLFDRVIKNVLNSASISAGDAIGKSVGNAVGNVTETAANGVVNDMQISQEKKQMALNEEKKVLDLPPTCPHCGAATTGQLVCRYCDCKIVE